MGDRAHARNYAIDTVDLLSHNSINMCDIVSHSAHRHERSSTERERWYAAADPVTVQTVSQSGEDMTEAIAIPGEVAQAAAAAYLGQPITMFPQPTKPIGSGLVAALIRAEHKASNTDNKRVFVYEEGVVWQRRRKNRKSADGWETERLDQFRWADISGFSQSSESRYADIGRQRPIPQERIPGLAGIR
jgi:hypothetical protein